MIDLLPRVDAVCYAIIAGLLFAISSRYASQVLRRYARYDDTLLPRVPPY